MSIKEFLVERSNEQCEICSEKNNLSVYTLPPKSEEVETSVYLCETCLKGTSDISSVDVNHWRCLNDSMWSEHLPVQVMAWRFLDSLGNQGESWATDLKSQMYLEEEVLDWAGALSGGVVIKDSNGTQLAQGDSVTLIKDLVVKGANFTAKRGTLVKNISLTDDPKYIEGRVNGTHIVLVAAFLKKV